MLTLVKVYQPSEGLEKWLPFQMPEGKLRTRPEKKKSMRLQVSTRDTSDRRQSVGPPRVPKKRQGLRIWPVRDEKGHMPTGGKACQGTGPKTLALDYEKQWGPMNSFLPHLGSGTLFTCIIPSTGFSVAQPNSQEKLEFSLFMSLITKPTMNSNFFCIGCFLPLLPTIEF